MAAPQQPESAPVAASAAVCCSNLSRVVEATTPEGSRVRRLEPLPFVVYGSSAGGANGRPVTPLEVYFPGKSSQTPRDCQQSTTSRNSGNSEAANNKLFVHYGAGFSNAAPPSRCHFVVHPDWVSEKRRGASGLKGAGGSQQTSPGGLQYGSG